MSNNAHQTTDISSLNAPELAALTELNLSGAAEGDDPPIFLTGDPCLVRSREDDGLNVHYQMCLAPPRGRELRVALPWLIEECCPNCQGQGVMYRWAQHNLNYTAVPCEECDGSGTLSHLDQIPLTISPELRGQRVIRKRRAGHFDARLGRRGDLILNLTWLERMRPTMNADPEAVEPLAALKGPSN